MEYVRLWQTTPKTGVAIIIYLFFLFDIDIFFAISSTNYQCLTLDYAFYFKLNLWMDLLANFVLIAFLICCNIIKQPLLLFLLGSNYRYNYFKMKKIKFLIVLIKGNLMQL